MISFDISPRDLFRWNAPKAAWSQWSEKDFFLGELFSAEDRFSIFNYTKFFDQIFTLLSLAEAHRGCERSLMRSTEIFGAIFNSFQRKNDSDTLEAWFLRIPFLNYVFYISKYFMKIHVENSCVNFTVVCPRRTKNIFYSNSSEKFHNSHFNALLPRGLRRGIVMRILTASVFHRWEIKQTSTI